MYLVSGTKNIHFAIRRCFATDPALLEKWHIAAPASLDECVARTLSDIRSTDFDQASFKFYRVYHGNKLLAYWGTEFGNYINLIFVKPAYRNKEFMAKFWEMIRQTVADPFYTAVYSKNEPAVRFYSRLGRKITEKMLHGHPLTVFRFDKEMR